MWNRRYYKQSLLLIYKQCFRSRSWTELDPDSTGAVNPDPGRPKNGIQNRKKWRNFMFKRALWRAESFSSWSLNVLFRGLLKKNMAFFIFSWHKIRCLDQDLDSAKSLDPEPVNLDPECVNLDPKQWLQASKRTNITCRPGGCRWSQRWRDHTWSRTPVSSGAARGRRRPSSCATTEWLSPLKVKFFIASGFRPRVRTRAFASEEKTPHKIQVWKKSRENYTASLMVQ